jgi:hypothetical protein
MKRRSSVACTRLSADIFDDGEWHELGDLRGWEALLLSISQSDEAFSDAVRIDTAPGEKLRRDEWLAFLNLAKHRSMPHAALFRKPMHETGVDVEYMQSGDPIVRLQITTAYRVRFDAQGKKLHGGHQDRLFREKLTSEGRLSGTGPFERRGDEILSNDSCEAWEQIEDSCRLGIIEAFEGKANHGAKDVSLLVKAVRYYEETMQDVDRFRSIMNAAAAVRFPMRYGEVIVVDYGEGFIWSR